MMVTNILAEQSLQMAFLQLVRGFKWQRFAQLLDDPSVGRMLRDVNLQDAPPLMTDDKEAVEHAVTA